MEHFYCFMEKHCTHLPKWFLFPVKITFDLHRFRILGNEFDYIVALTDRRSVHLHHFTAVTTTDQTRWCPVYLHL